jgi:hypothetical protein
MEQPKAQNQLDVYADELRAKLPAAPEPLTDWYIQWAPWIFIGLGGLGVLFSLGGLFLSALIGPFLLLAGAEGVMLSASAFAALAVLLISSGVEVVGGYFMLRRSRTGWWLLAAGIVLGLLYSLVGMNVFSLVFNLAIGYVHLMVKPSYL